MPGCPDAVGKTLPLPIYAFPDTTVEPVYDRLTAIAARALGTPVALIILANVTQQWIKSRSGHDIPDSRLLRTLCAETMARHAPLVILDTYQEARFSADPSVIDAPAIRFYAGAALLAVDGSAIGTLCVCDTAPHSVFAEPGPTVLRDLATLTSELLAGQLQAREMERSRQRTDLTDTMLDHAARAATVEDAVSAAMRALGAACAARCGQLWRRLPHNGRLQLAATFGAPARGPPDSAVPSQAPGPDAPDGLVASALHAGQPLLVILAMPVPFGQDPVLADLRARGLEQVIAMPLKVGAQAYVIILGFDQPGTSRRALLEDLTVIRDALEPGLNRKADLQRARLLNSPPDLAADGIIVTAGGQTPDLPLRIVYVNDSFCRSTGYAATELLGQSPFMLHGPETSEATVQQIASRLHAGETASALLVYYRKDGSTFTTDLRFSPILDADGIATHVVGQQRDVTARILDDQRRSERDGSFRTMFKANPLPMFVFDAATLQFLMVNQAGESFYGWSEDVFLTMTLNDLKLPGESHDPLCLAGARSIANRGIWTHRRANGSIAHVGGVAQPHPIEGRDGILSVVWDITEVQTARADLKRNYEQLRDLATQLRAKTEELSDAIRMAQLGTWRLSADRREMTWSDEIYVIIGRERNAFPPTFANSIEVIHPEDRKLFRRSAIVRGADHANRHVQARIVRPDGRLRHVRIEFRPATGQARGDLFGYVQDISERWETQQALIRSEKLAILGHLTGGIAHDFNNLLTVVTLNLEEVIAELAEDDELQGILVAALQAAQRGADLTNQLLSYARQAPLRPQAISLATLFRTFSPLIRRAFGPTYALRLVIDDEDCTARVDAAQLQAAILNVALNARDAMPEGGEVVLTVGSATFPGDGSPAEAMPGRYAMISVADRGHGIKPDVLPHIFEPFYTTKEMGAGSGLGLSMVDGFVGQSGGHTTVQTRLGEGTTVTVFLPIAAELPSVPSQNPAPASVGRALLVEDQLAVLATVSRMFTQLGYAVCGVTSAAAALAELDRGQDFTLMFTDIVLPGEMDGIALAKMVASRAPHIRVVLTSGFSEYNHKHSDLAGIEILMKPYKRRDLLERLNKIMVPRDA